MFVPEGEPQKAPKPPPIVLELCSGCAVRQQCEDYGRDNGSTGWWGGIFMRFGFTLREWRGLRTWAKELVLTNDDPSLDLRAEIGLCKPMKKMTQALADEIRRRYAEGGRTRQQLADDVGIPLNTLKQILYHQSWNGQRNVLAAEKAPRAKLSNDDVIEIKRCLAAGEEHKPLAERFGVSTTAICNINTGRRWASITAASATATVVTVPHDEWPPKDPRPDTLYLRRASPS